jgi:tRNA dimethylallyltransferase
MNIQKSPARPAVALIAGPTASGKSALALRLAEIAGGEIINADASQLYRDLAIISASPSAEDMARAPHHLFGYVDGAIPASAADWAADARAAIADCHDRGVLPILAGGSGLYLRTLLDGIAPIPPIDPAIRAAVRLLPVASAYAALVHEDPAAAARLRATDTTRVARALEVVRSTGRPLGEWHQHRSGGIADLIQLSPTILLPPREWLYARCDARFEAMLAQGAEKEVKALLERGLNAELPVMRAIGVREIAAWLAGEIDRKMMIERAQTATRRYAKRQYTWLAHQPPVAWPRVNSQLDDDNIEQLVIKLRNNALTR